MFDQNVTEHNPAPSPSGHPLLSGPPTLSIFTRYHPCPKTSATPSALVEWLEESFVELAGWKKPPMLVGIVPFLLAFGGPNVGKRPLLRQVTPRMLLADVSELTNMPHVAASAVSAFAAPSMLLSGSTTSPEVAADVTGLFTLAGFSAPEVAVISTLAAAFFALTWTWTTMQTNKVCDRHPHAPPRPPLHRPPPAAHLAAADTAPPPHHTLTTPSTTP